MESFRNGRPPAWRSSCATAVHMHCANRCRGPETVELAADGGLYSNVCSLIDTRNRNGRMG